MTQPIREVVSRYRTVAVVASSQLLSSNGSGWLAYPVLALDLTGGDLWGAFALLAPLCMYWLLVYVSGIPPLEEHMLAHRGEAFRRYQMTTNAFFPGPPKTFAEDE